MTDLSDKCKEWWPSMCKPGFDLTDGLTATQIYNGTTRPDFWIAVYAHVDQADANVLMVNVLKNAAALHGAGDLKTRIDGLSAADDAATLNAHRLWSLARKKAGSQDGYLERSFYEQVQYLLTAPQDPKGIQAPFELLIDYHMGAESVDRPTARLNMYAYLRSQITETAFKGSYT